MSRKRCPVFVETQFSLKNANLCTTIYLNYVKKIKAQIIHACLIHLFSRLVTFKLTFNRLNFEIIFICWLNFIFSRYFSDLMTWSLWKLKSISWLNLVIIIYCVTIWIFISLIIWSKRSFPDHSRFKLPNERVAKKSLMRKAQLDLL